MKLSLELKLNEVHPDVLAHTRKGCMKLSSHTATCIDPGVLLPCCVTAQLWQHRQALLTVSQCLYCHCVIQSDNSITVNEFPPEQSPGESFPILNKRDSREGNISVSSHFPVGSDGFVSLHRLHRLSASLHLWLIPATSLSPWTGTVSVSFLISSATTHKLMSWSNINNSHYSTTSESHTHTTVIKIWRIFLNKIVIFYVVLKDTLHKQNIT